MTEPERLESEFLRVLCDRVGGGAIYANYYRPVARELIEMTLLAHERNPGEINSRVFRG